MRNTLGGYENAFSFKVSKARTGVQINKKKRNKFKRKQIYALPPPSKQKQKSNNNNNQSKKQIIKINLI